MSTLELEHIKHTSSSSNNLSVHSDGTVVSNNKLGIGTVPNATFGSLLYAQGTPAANKPIISGYSQGNSNNAGMALFNDSGNRGIWTTGSTMRFTRSYEGNSTTDMNIDTSGHVTMPNQPAFSITGGPNSYRDGSNNETVILHGQSGSFPGDMNIGGHFSYSNGRFTAPVAGNYMFTYTLTSNDTNAHFIELRKNNSSQTTVLLYTTQYQSGCHSTIYTLAANDYITAQRRGTGYGVYSAVFSGFLIG